jgi:hypothetical protein
MGTRNDAPLRLTDFRDLAAGTHAPIRTPIRTPADTDPTAVRP